LESTHNWFNVNEKGREVGAVFFDFRKAFDSVPHRVLLEKLDDFKLIIYLYSEFIATSLK